MCYVKNEEIRHIINKEPPQRVTGDLCGGAMRESCDQLSLHTHALPSRFLSGYVNYMRCRFHGCKLFDTHDNLSFFPFYHEERHREGGACS